MCALPIWSRLGSTGKADCSSLILVAPAAGRMALAALSLHTQQLAVAAAPSQRVNAIAFEAGHTAKLAVPIDWLAKASMVTGQLILLSEQPEIGSAASRERVGPYV